MAVGFGGHRGSVVAGGAWGGPMERMPVPPARDGSIEDLLHEQVGSDALFVFPGRVGEWLTETRPHRAIGVVYHPDRERLGNYVPTVLADRYDAFCYLDHIAALRPLGPEAPAQAEELEPF